MVTYGNGVSGGILISYTDLLNLCGDEIILLIERLNKLRVASKPKKA
jgi:hypothetical protein